VDLIDRNVAILSLNPAFEIVARVLGASLNMADSLL
jgi:hypothetical protein